MDGTECAPGKVSIVWISWKSLFCTIIERQSSVKIGNRKRKQKSYKWFHSLLLLVWTFWPFFQLFTTVFRFVFVIFLVVLQGPLHLEIKPAASGPWWELGLLVKVWLLLQNLWRWSSFPQQAVQQPSVSNVTARELILGGKRTIR